MSIDCPDAVTVVVDGHGDPGGASGVAFANVGGETHSAASVTRGVLEQVGQDLVHQAGIDEQQGQIRIESPRKAGKGHGDAAAAFVAACDALARNSASNAMHDEFQSLNKALRSAGAGHLWGGYGRQ